MDGWNTTGPLAVGSWVMIRGSGFGKSQIVEYRGPLGPGGAHIYRVQVRRKPHPAYGEFRADQLEVVPAGN